MRYLCQKKTVSKLFDGILDKEEVVALLNNLKEKEVTCSIQIKSGPVFEFVRILEVEGTRFVWRLIKNGVSLKRTSFIADLNFVFVTVDDDIVAKLKPNPSRWSTLDPSDIL